MNDKNKNVVPISLVDDENLGMQLIELNATKAIEIANKRVDFFKQIKNVSLKMTNAKDWLNQNGKPYLGGSGAEKLKPIWGIYIKDDVKIEKIQDGEFFYCRCTGTAGSKVTGEESFFVGGRNANDPFFSNQKNLDQMDVEKAAYTNFEVNAITRLLGLRGITWDDLKQAKIEKEIVGKIEYEKGKKGGSTIPTELVNLRSAISNALLEWTGGDIEESKKLLKEVTGGISSTSDIKTAKQAKIIQESVEKMIREKGLAELDGENKTETSKEKDND